MAERVLAADVGGTKTHLALYAIGGRQAGGAAPGAADLAPAREAAGAPPGEAAGAPVREATFASRQYGGLEELLRDFLADEREGIAAAAFGIAGPVVDDAVTATNLPWRITAASLRELLGGAPVRLLNDLEATAYGALVVPPDHLLTLNEGRTHHGNRAVIAAGTGLGQAFLFWDGTEHVPAATEGGHADFAPRDELEMALLRFLQGQHTRVSYERVLSGPGLHSIFRFLDEVLQRPVAATVRERMRSGDPSAVIGDAGVAGACPTCEEAVERFVSLYGAQAGNLALTVMALGGVYVGGGIVTKLRSRMTTGTFMRAFTAKGRYTRLMEEIPVHVILEPKTALLGAAHAARALVA